MKSKKQLEQEVIDHYANHDWGADKVDDIPKQVAPMTDQQYYDKLSDILAKSPSVQEFLNELGQDLVMGEDSLHFGLKMLANLLNRLDPGDTRRVGLLQTDIEKLSKIIVDPDYLEAFDILEDASMAYKADYDFGAWINDVLGDEDHYDLLIHHFVNASYNQHFDDYRNKKDAEPTAGYYVNHDFNYYFVLNSVLAPFFAALAEEFVEAGFRVAYAKGRYYFDVFKE